MKRMIHALLAAAVLVSAMTCTAFAATDGYTADEAGVVVCNDIETLDYVASYDKAVAGNQYVLLVVKPDEDGSRNLSKAENILYIDQKQADGTDISFNVLPVAEKVAYSEVLLGGTFADGESPKTLGYLLTPAEKEPEPDRIKGDFNGNGRISLLEVKKALTFYVNKNNPEKQPTEEEFWFCDYNDNGSIQLIDVKNLLKMYVNQSIS